MENSSLIAELCGKRENLERAASGFRRQLFHLQVSSFVNRCRKVGWSSFVALRNLLGSIPVFPRWQSALLVGATSFAPYLVLSPSIMWSTVGAVATSCGLLLLSEFPNDAWVSEKLRSISERSAYLAGRIDSLQSLFSPVQSELTEIKSRILEQQRLASEWARSDEAKRQLAEGEARERRQRLLQENWRAYRGDELEEFLARVLCELGYEVEQTGRAGDQGVDLIAKKFGIRAAIQAKGRTEYVSNGAVQEVYTGMAIHRCDICVVVTGSSFAKSAIEAAQATGCILVDENLFPNFVLGKWELIPSDHVVEQ